jgi:ribosomal protein S18 acetylase RimI-like enzyme
MTVEIRNARVTDIPHMAYFAIQAFGGYAEVMYENVIPGRTVQQIMEHRFSRSGTTSSITNSRIAEDSGTVLGGLHAFPADLAANDPVDLLISKDRDLVFAPFEHLHSDGSYYINAVAVYPGYRGQGVARRLMEEAEAEARDQDYTDASLITFAENVAAVRLYRNLGYREFARQPVVYHPSLDYSGDLLLMTREL